MRFIAVAVALSAFAAAPAGASSFDDPYDQLAIMGDSLADPGNIFFGFPPFLPDGLEFPPPPYYQGQFSNGPNYAALLQQSFEEKGKATRNYAFGAAGAVTDDDPIPDLPLQTLFMFFDPLFDPTPNTLTLLNFGGNDMLGAFRDPDLSLLSLAVTMSRAAQSIGLFASVLSEQFGITDFVIPNLGSVGAAPRLIFDYDPYFNDAVTPALADWATRQFNSALEQVSENLRLQGLNIIEIDVYSRLNEIIADPSIVGLDVPPGKIDGCGIPTFEDPDTPAEYDFSACIDDPENAQFLFFDDVHPVRQIHEELARLVRTEVLAANVTPVPVPATSGLLLIALAGLSYVKLRKKH